MMIGITWKILTNSWDVMFHDKCVHLMLLFSRYAHSLPEGLRAKGMPTIPAQATDTEVQRSLSFVGNDQQFVSICNMPVGHAWHATLKQVSLFLPSPAIKYKSNKEK